MKISTNEIPVLNFILNLFFVNPDFSPRVFIYSIYVCHMKTFTNYIFILKRMLNIFFESPDFLPSAFIISIYRFHEEISSNYISTLNIITKTDRGILNPKSNAIQHHRVNKKKSKCT